MKFFKTLLSTALLFASSAYAQDGYRRGEDPQADAIRDMQTGFQGLQQAAKDPVLMAQLMEDLKNPELMAEAQKMMNSPEFKKQMKQFEKSKEFKESQKKMAEMMNDPQTAARMQAQAEHMVSNLFGHENLIIYMVSCFLIALCCIVTNSLHISTTKG